MKKSLFDRLSCISDLSNTEQSVVIEEINPTIETLNNDCLEAFGVMPWTIENKDGFNVYRFNNEAFKQMKQICLSGKDLLYELTLYH